MEATRKPRIPLEVRLHFKKLFEQEKRNLLYNQTIMDENFHSCSEERSDDADFTASELERSMRIRLRNREALYLKRIERSLQRITEGTFGSCVSCDGAIELKRLEVRPTTFHCISCKEEQEIQESQHIDSRRPKSMGRLMKTS